MISLSHLISVIICEDRGDLLLYLATLLITTATLRTSESHAQITTGTGPWNINFHPPSLMLDELALWQHLLDKDHLLMPFMVLRFQCSPTILYDNQIAYILCIPSKSWEGNIYINSTIFPLLNIFDVIKASLFLL